MCTIDSISMFDEKEKYKKDVLFSFKIMYWFWYYDNILKPIK